MKYCLWMIALLFFSIEAQATPGKIHAFIVGDSLPEYVGFGVAQDVVKDITRMQEFLCILSKSIGFELDLHVLQGREVTIRNIEKGVTSLVGAPQDMFFFYYTGHGGQDEKKRKWPVIDLPRRGSLAGMAIVRYFRKLSQRSSFVIFDCCNSGFMPGQRTVRVRGDSFFKGVHSQAVQLPGLKKLFLETNGLLLATGAVRGQSADGGGCDEIPSSDELGGCFTTAFLYALCESCRKADVSWEQVFEKVTKICRKGQCFQQPYYRIEQDLLPVY